MDRKFEDYEYRWDSGWEFPTPRDQYLGCIRRLLIGERAAVVKGWFSLESFKVTQRDRVLEYLMLRAAPEILPHTQYESIRNLIENASNLRDQRVEGKQMDNFTNKIVIDPISEN